MSGPESPLERCELSASSPNPGIDPVTITFTLAIAGRARLTLSDVKGRRIRTLLDADRPVGRCTVTWNGAMDAQAHAGAGVYFARLEADGTSRMRRWVRLASD